MEASFVGQPRILTFKDAITRWVEVRGCKVNWDTKEIENAVGEIVATVDAEYPPVIRFLARIPIIKLEVTI